MNQYTICISQNIYGDLKPKKIVKQVEDVIDTIEEKNNTTQK